MSHLRPDPAEARNRARPARRGTVRSSRVSPRRTQGGVEPGLRAPDRRPGRRRARARVQRRRLPLEAPDCPHATSSAAGERQRLVVGTGQFFGNPAVVDDTGTGVQRRYTRIAGHVHRSTSTDRLAPTFTKIDAFVVTGNAAFSVETAGRRRPASARRLPLRHRLRLAVRRSRAGRGRALVGRRPRRRRPVRVLRPGRRRGGQRRREHEQGLLLRRRRAAARPDPERPARARPAGADGRERLVHGRRPVVGRTAPRACRSQVTVDGGPFVAPGAGRVGHGDRRRHPRRRGARGDRCDRRDRRADRQTAPDVVFETPAAGASYEPGSTQRAAYECVDPGSGVGALQRPGRGREARSRPSHRARRPSRSQVRDRAGNTATRSVTYNVAYRKIVFTSQRSGNGRHLRRRPRRLGAHPADDTQRDRHRARLVARREEDRVREPSRTGSTSTSS